PWPYPTKPRSHIPKRRHTTRHQHIAEAQQIHIHPRLHIVRIIPRFLLLLVTRLDKICFIRNGNGVFSGLNTLTCNPILSSALAK
ncbi:hypothetical protein LINPERPRIM_LOCUS2708, partial [Linum perenne]